MNTLKNDTELISMTQVRKSFIFFSAVPPYWRKMATMIRKYGFLKIIQFVIYFGQ